MDVSVHRPVKIRLTLTQAADPHAFEMTAVQHREKVSPGTSPEEKKIPAVSLHTDGGDLLS